MDESTQAEPRNERATLTMTASEKAALRLLASLNESDESAVLRGFVIGPMMAQADEIRRKLQAA